MFSKILITIAVVVIAFFFIRQRNLAERSGKVEVTSVAEREAAQRRQAERQQFSSDLRIAAYLTVVLMVGLGATLYYFRWQDDHRILTVTLHRDSQANPISYEVYKYQLQERSFVTVDGTTVTVASSERMEVQGLEP